MANQKHIFTLRQGRNGNPQFMHCASLKAGFTCELAWYDR